eukprot:gene27358-4659_t
MLVFVTASTGMCIHSKLVRRPILVQICSMNNSRSPLVQKPKTRGLGYTILMFNIKKVPAGPLLLQHYCAHNRPVVGPFSHSALIAALYYKPETRGLDFVGLMEDIKNAPAGSLFLLHACAHNPTGVDPSIEQWKEISKLMKEKDHFPLFDMAYQGFASGDCERDAQAIRIFLADGHRLATSQSYAKNMGLYGQRAGAFSIVCDNEKEAIAVESQMKAVARAMYSNPPLHGALLVSKILSCPDLKQQWYGEVKGMADRIITMRGMLRQNMEDAGSKWSWNHVTDQIGMFAFSGISPEMVDTMATKHNIYMTRNGRISMAGVNTKNVERLAKAIHDVISTAEKK